MGSLDKFENFKLLFCGVAISLWLYWIWQRRNLYRFSLKFPGQWGVPLLGILYKIPHLNYFMPVITDQLKSHNTVCTWMGPYPFILTQDPEFIGKVLSSPDLLNKAETFYRPLYNGFAGGLTASPADEWYRNRKLINPSFNHTVLLGLLPTFNKAKSLTLLKLDALVGKGENKLQDMLQRVMLGLTYETTMGKIMKQGEEVDEDMTKKWQYIAKHAMIQVILSLINLDTLYGLNYRYRQLREYLKNCTIDLIERKIISKQQSSDNSPNGTSKSVSSDMDIKKSSNIFIDQAIQLYEQQKFSFHDVVSESNMLVAASFETTANTTFAALVMLAMHPEVQEKLYQEIVGVFPDKDFEMEYSHMEQLPYLDMVINEVLRVNPPLPTIARQVVTDTQLTKDILLPKGLQIIISIFDLHRRTDIWGPNADKFNPDNFLPENIKDKHPYAFIPFSKGIRNCIGWRYAIFSLKVMIAGFVRNYKFTTTFRYEDLRYMSKIVLFYVDEPGVEIQRR